MKKINSLLIIGILITTILFGGWILSEGYQELSSNSVVAEEHPKQSVVKDFEEEKPEETDSEEDTEIKYPKYDSPSDEPSKEINYEDSKQEQENKQSNSDKKVFLTFDDGPTHLTPMVLDILKEYEVNATFFTIGKLMEKYPEYVGRAYDEGNMVLPHSYSHDFAIYSTLDTFYEDFYKAEDTYKEVLGFEAPPIFRFPGGSSNHSSFNFGGKQFMPKLTEDIKEKGYYYIDWNVDSGDTGPDYNNAEKLLENVLQGVVNTDYAIVLFHDLVKNEKILEILPEIIGTLQEQGYVFETFRDISQDELDKMVELKLANKPIVR
ncbi:MAG: polysaccharide deacetylase [Clostridiaceae bacterium]|nr:polysaccharide deacetylase [Clostridiaceae bacterium]